ncbi:hypothetical protein [Actinoplanes sp. CA-252034]|uniref:hypothetical protein n=1 Tax=Actinoplanes sp. CA-252034 TaxID=3239906 RepID=UPI003D971E2F
MTPQKPVSGAGQRPAPGSAQGAGPTDTPPAVGSNAPTNALRTGFTAADVAAHRRKQAAPEHERSLAQATSGFPVVTPRNAPSTGGEAPAASGADGEKPGTPEQSGATAQSGATGKSGTPEQSGATAQSEATAQSGATGKSGAAERSGAAGKPGAAEQSERSEKPETSGKPESAGTPETADASDAAAGLETPEQPETPDAPERPGAVDAEAETPAPTEAGDEPVAATDVTDEKTTPADEPAVAEPEAKAEVEETPAEYEDKTSVVALPPPPAAEGEKTSLLLPMARPRPAADEDKTSVVSMPPRRRIITANEPATQVVGDLEADPGFARPSRPAWTPMQMRPVERRTNGITILGTTLTRRQAAIGLGIVLTFLLLVGIIVVQAFGEDDANDPDLTKAQTGASAPAVPGGGRSEGPKQSGGTSPSPAQPSSPSPSAASGIPAGWRLYQGQGYSFPVPKSVSGGGGGGNGTTLNWGDGRQIRIDIVPGKNDPVDYLNRDRNTGYDRSGPTVKDFNGVQAADLEYSRNASGGTKQRVVRRVFVVKSTTYVLTWYTVDSDWEAAKGDLANIYAGFQAK